MPIGHPYVFFGEMSIFSSAFFFPFFKKIIFTLKNLFIFLIEE